MASPYTYRGSATRGNVRVPPRSQDGLAGFCFDNGNEAVRFTRWGIGPGSHMKCF